MKKVDACWNIACKPVIVFAETDCNFVLSLPVAAALVAGAVVWPPAANFCLLKVECGDRIWPKVVDVLVGL